MSAPDASPTASRKGWRLFECPDCDHAFEEATRDRHSPSGTDCPRCHGWCSPQASREDESLAVDCIGNLTMPWSERILPAVALNP